jgi:TonB-dependent starch-binding outer membrane protein SusC
MELLFVPLWRAARSLLTSKCLLAMRLTFILLSVAVLQASANGYSQGITLSVKDVPLEKVFAEIKKQTGYNFVFTKQLLEGSHPVDLQVKNATLQQTLDKCLAGQPLDYDIINNTVVIKPKTPSPPVDVRGRIINENGIPVEGASVQIKGTDKGTTTNSDGFFELKNVEDNAVLIISSVGIETFEIKLNGRTELNLTAKIRVNMEEEVIVNKGYYTERQKLSVGNVGRITAKDIEKQPVMNALLAVSGLIPGINITQQSGTPGSGIKVQIRGTNSIANGNDPLYVIDGVPVSPTITPTTANLAIGLVFGTSVPPSILNYINPNDIESIEVLKDADATSIYGSRGANGVILVTTKKGKVGKSTVNAALNSGVGMVAHFMDLMNKEQYIRYRNMAFATSGAPPSSTDYDMNGTWGDDVEKDWQKILIGGKAQYLDAQASLSGGNNQTQFFLSGSLHRETTVYPGNYYNARPAVHFSLSNASLNQKLKILVTANYANDKGSYPYVDIVGHLFYYPNAPKIHNEDGSLNWQNSTYFNPFQVFEVRSKLNSNSLVASARLDYQVLRGLTLSASAGYNHTQLEGIQAVPTTYTFVVSTSYPYANFSFNNSSSWNVEPQISYEHRLGKGKLMLLAGATFLETVNDNSIISGTGYTDNNLLESLAAAATITKNNVNNSQYRASSGYARINYNWGDRYVINLTGRKDGSSRFGPNKRIANFGAAGVGWIFSNESFFKKQLPFINYGKLRASYGSSGNDQIDDYSYYDLYNFTNFNPTYQNTQGLFPAGLFNPELAWEINRKAELGLELGLWNDRLALSASVYRNRSGNQLVSHPLPAITGFTTVTDNLAALVQNTGWEFQLNSVNIKHRDFSWRSSFNLSLERNKLLAFPELEKNVAFAQRFIIGEPISASKVLTCLGVDPITGVYTFMTGDGNATFTPSLLKDKNKMINRNPDFYGGLNNSFTYRNFSLDISLQFKKQVGFNPLYMGTVQPGYFNVFTGRNWMADVLDAWQKPGDVTTIQRLSTKVGDAAYNAYTGGIPYSDYNYTDASFVRIRNVMLAWSLPESFRNKMHIRNAKLYVQVQNLYTFTNYKGLDPENGGQYMPPLRMIVGGFQLSL